MFTPNYLGGRWTQFDCLTHIFFTCVGLVKFNHHHLLFMFSSVCGWKAAEVEVFLFPWHFWVKSKGPTTGTSTSRCMSDVFPIEKQKGFFPPVSWVVFRDVMYFFLLLVLSVEVQISVCLKDIHVLSIWCGVSTVPTDQKMHHVHHLTILASDLTLKWWINSDDKKTHILYIYIHIGRFFSYSPYL